MRRAGTTTRMQRLNTLPPLFTVRGQHRERADRSGNRELKQKCWQDIGEEIYENWDVYSTAERNVLGKEMQTKWKSIRDHFTKELKMKKPTKNRKKRKYIYFDNLQFLIPIVESRPKHSNATLTTNSTELQKLEPQETEPLLWKSLQGTSTEDITGNHTRKEASALKRKRCHQEDSVEAVKEFSKILSYSSALQREESQSDSTGNKAFLMSLLPLMNRLNDEEAMSVRMQMMEVVRDGIKGTKRL
uniref:MADF domain-containing protein n=1 Tax=Timema shepardi TaxID=629360 RepID=A0A7R9B275_TIMSH|nr:unnamed protein product [Timema shepardi]